MGQELEQDLNGRPTLALFVSCLIHGALLALVVYGPGLIAPKRIIRPGDRIVVVTPVSDLKPQPEPEKPPPPPEAQQPAVKKPEEKPPLKKKKPGKKIVPKKAEKKKPPKPAKPKLPPKMTPKKLAPAPSRQAMRMEGEAFKYDYYVKIVKRKVEERWITHGLNISGKSSNPEVYFRVTKSGGVAGVRLVKSSGSEELDKSALDAIKDIKLPPLPAGYRKDYLGVYFDFQYAQRD